MKIAVILSLIFSFWNFVLIMIVAYHLGVHHHGGVTKGSGVKYKE